MAVVEDDDAIGTAMVEALATAGYDVERCTDGTSLLALVERRMPDLLLLDAGLPDIDGFMLCRWVRERDDDVPVVLVTARDAEIDVVVGLDAGATDYVTKPFSMNILLARVRAHLRGAAQHDRDAPFDVGRLRIDPAAHRVFVDGTEVALRPRELELLLVLCRDAGRVLTREHLLAEVWDLHWDTSTKTLDMHVLALRRKLGDALSLSTVRGVGYRVDVP